MVKIVVNKSMLQLIMGNVMSITVMIPIMFGVLITMIVSSSVIRMVLVAMRVSRETMSLRVTEHVRVVKSMLSSSMHILMV